MSGLVIGPHRSNTQSYSWHGENLRIDFLCFLKKQITLISDFIRDDSYLFAKVLPLSV